MKLMMSRILIELLMRVCTDWISNKKIA